MAGRTRKAMERTAARCPGRAGAHIATADRCHIKITEKLRSLPGRANRL